MSSLREDRVLAEIRAGLLATPKRLPFECFYDDLGSALFEAITLLPEYGLTRAGRRLLERHAGSVGRLAGAPLDVVELGSGSGRATRVLLEALARNAPLRYFPVDISAAALAENVREVGPLEGVTVEPLRASHFDGLRAATARRRPHARLLALFLGGNIGNFDRPAAAAFFRRVREALRPGDAFLVAADLEKPEPALLAAYDDPIGVTAAFNLNVLARLNRELGAGFDLRAFSHRALYNREERRVEMHLVSGVEQAVTVRALELDLRFARGETIWTESSYRFTPGELPRLGAAAGFETAAEWIDDEWPFAQALLIAR